jgi:protein SCO1/2
MKSVLRRLCLVVIAAACGLAVSRAKSEPPVIADELPPELEGVGIVERLDQQAPLDLPFKDETGRNVTLRDFLKPGRPLILTPVYYRCPMLCNHLLNGLVNGLNEVEWSAGKEFSIVSFSINPNEGPEVADVKKRAYLTQYKRQSAKDGWHFLTGSPQSIDAMCKAIGFGYRPDGKGDYAHTATILFLTPDGKISRYMNDVLFEPRDLRFALVEASQGSIGSAMDKFLLFMCYQYDPHSNSYAASAMKIMRLGGLVTIMLLGTGLGLLWWRGSHGRTAPIEGVQEALE